MKVIEKKGFIYLEINSSLVMNYFYPEIPLGLPFSKEPLKSGQVWVWLGLPQHIQSKILAPHATFLLVNKSM